jgi:hypothetical protein
VTAAGRLLLLLLGLGLVLGEPASADDEEEEADLQERLTEREDKRRPLEPFTLDVLGHPLTIGGEFELELEPVWQRVLVSEVDGEDVREDDRVLWTQQLQLEAFYTIGEPLSAFLQFQGVFEEDLLGRTVDDVSDRYLERGEMWLYSENVLGSGLSFDVGRLDFEDDRRWWWDDELDAARVEWERGDFDVAVAVGQELASDRSDISFVDPEQERVLRVLLESTWDMHENHSLQLFLLHQKDHSPRNRVGDVVVVDHEDESDASLTWLGLRQTGIFELDSHGYLGYWLDTGIVRGRERLHGFSDPIEPDRRRSEVEEVSRHSVRGWAVDVGASWLLPHPCEPRLFAGYAFGSGDEPDGRSDHAYRQSGIQENEAGFGGVELFQSYGLLLQPELSNLHIVTAGVGFSVLRSSSLDLVYHFYRLDEPSDELRDSMLEFELDERNQRLGHALDLVLALEEWERLEFTIAAGVLRTGSAFEGHGRDWVVGGLFAVRYGF